MQRRGSVAMGCWSKKCQTCRCPSKPLGQLVKCECTEVMLQVWMVMGPFDVASVNICSSSGVDGDETWCGVVVCSSTVVVGLCCWDGDETLQSGGVVMGPSCA
ncbi:hypothetical protein Pcinc_034824 [Petrolisthes cinctipes]|uniref:Uncharacterized protein n=1 Tax=Petrolisthes cinctipes TaxID=88211 RepID=A0AAE1C0W5_PETCI|nr:hypothetical protein Pcinc_034824 [Petrolisthes cinctipes]